MMVKVGQKVRFDALYFMTGYGSEAIRGHMVTGKVIMVNEPHRYFLVEYGNKAKMSFKFNDIGQVVKIVG